MTTYDFLYNFLDPSCHKTAYSQKAYTDIQANCIPVQATTLYSIYTSLVWVNPLTWTEFYNEIKTRLFYDKYICEHGTEFYYYIKFNRTHPKYKANKTWLDTITTKYTPATLTDVIRYVKAVGYIE